MKRYRVLNQDFDYRANNLAIEIQEWWEPQVKELHRANKHQILVGLRTQYGEHEHDAKASRFEKLGALPCSVIAYHNAFLRQARDAYVMGAFYPALTASSALGERVLNHLMLTLRDDFKRTPEYKDVYRKDSFDDWARCIRTLSAWGILRAEVAEAFGKLAVLRHKSLHFNLETETEVRAQALEACVLMTEIVDLQFGAFGAHPWFIANTDGVAFIKKEAEHLPFIRRVYIPNCVYVGPKHTLAHDGAGRFVLDTDPECGTAEIDDAHFVQLFRAPEAQVGQADQTDAHE